MVFDSTGKQIQNTLNVIQLGVGDGLIGVVPSLMIVQGGNYDKGQYYDSIIFRNNVWELVLTMYGIDMYFNPQISHRIYDPYNLIQSCQYNSNYNDTKKTLSRTNTGDFNGYKHEYYFREKEGSTPLTYYFYLNGEEDYKIMMTIQ